jgi:hypothetical protein
MKVITSRVQMKSWAGQAHSGPKRRKAGQNPKNEYFFSELLTDEIVVVVPLACKTTLIKK